MPRIAEDLRRWRLHRDLTQAEAADELQLSLTSYHKFERGARIPSYREIQRLRMRIAADTPQLEWGEAVGP
jgi:transcriptional regulator with XRE-family HTH domain